MTAAEWKRAAKPLAAALPEFEPMKFGFVRKGEWVAGCFFADSSAFKASVFYLHAFALPLFIPTDHLYFDFGFRVGTAGRWDGVSDDVVDAVRGAVPALSKLASLDGLLEAADDPEVNVYHAEMRLCIAILRGDGELLNQSRARLATWRPATEWEQPVLDRSVALMADVEEGGREAGLAVLDRRRALLDGLLR